MSEHERGGRRVSDPARYVETPRGLNDRWRDVREIDPGGDGTFVVAELPDGRVRGLRIEEQLRLGDPVALGGSTYLVKRIGRGDPGGRMEHQRVWLRKEGERP